MNAPIHLAHEPSFEIGPIHVYPPTHEVGRDHERVVLEPRVMQVLVALNHADGGVVTRDELILRCWDGRVVGDDAIHRTLSRLRRLTEGIAKDAFRIDTITKVGYRMVRPGSETAAATSSPNADALVGEREGRHRVSWDRRAVLGAAGAGAVLAGGGLWFVAAMQDEAPTETQSLVARARGAMLQGTPDQTASAVSLLHQAIARSPEDPAAWGLLSLVYFQQAGVSGAAARVQIEARCRAAAARALELDPANAEAMTALAARRPFYRRWSEAEADFKRILAIHPDHWAVNKIYGIFLAEVGRFRAALPHLDRSLAGEPRSPHLYWERATALWSMGRLDEADAAIARAVAQWPRHYGIWFVHVRLLNFTGRARAALAMVDDAETRPVGIPDWNFDLARKEARAMETRAPADVEAAILAHRNASRRGVGFAENAMRFAGAVGRLDEFFDLAMGYFFNRGFQLGEQRFAPEQGTQTAPNMRFTGFLFQPTAASARGDSRFAQLMRETRLEAYWQAAGAPPDYLA